jgi:cytochrome b6-f complex subunit 4
MEKHVYTAEDDPIPFFPQHFMTEFKVALGMIAVLVAISFIPFFRMELGAPANPMDTPVGIKPEWYFLAIYQVIKFIPKTAGALLPFALVGLIFILPFIDRRPETTRRPTRIRAALTAVGLVGFVILTIWGRM